MLPDIAKAGTDFLQPKTIKGPANCQAFETKGDFPRYRRMTILFLWYQSPWGKSENQQQYDAHGHQPHVRCRFEQMLP